MIAIAHHQRVIAAGTSMEKFTARVGYFEKSDGLIVAYE